MLKAYTNCSIYTGNGVETNKAIIAENGVVQELVNSQSIPEACAIIDLDGSGIAPSFIDLQIYGGNGKMFSHELSTDALKSIYEYCYNGGAANFMITMATNSIEKILKGIEEVRAYRDAGLPGLLGLHLEGPYINSAKKGAHIEKYIKKPQREEVQMLLERGKGVIKMVTIAPEVCDEEIIELFLGEDIIVSAGHSNANYRQGLSAFDKGIPVATHLFNAMSPLQGRELGMVGAVYDHPKVAASIICDGVHVDFAAVRISKKIMHDRLFFITDAVTEVLESDYPHIFKGDRYTLPDGTLSGSSLTMMKSVANAVNHVGISLEEALRMATLYPATLLDPSLKVGRIQKGYLESFVVFNAEYEVTRMISS